MSQYDDYMADFDSVVAGVKPVVIIERRKSPKAYIAGFARAHKIDVYHRQVDLKDSDEYPHPALLVGDRNAVVAVLELLVNRPNLDRDAFQIAMGACLGYSYDSCVEFARSNLALTCGCQLCGGPTPESRADTEQTKRRLTEQGA